MHSGLLLVIGSLQDNQLYQQKRHIYVYNQWLTKLIWVILNPETSVKQTNLFTETLAEFIKDKSFEFVSGLLRVKAPDISIARLSSGEKQILILLIETLLQRQVPYIFLADEPELSLHISWQRNVISAIQKLNPSAQVIVATHSPEIAGKFRGSLLDMEDLTHA